MRIIDWSSYVCSSDLDVDDARCDRRIKLARPQRLAADLGKCAFLMPVAGRGHRYDDKRLRVEPMRRDQRRRGLMRLRHGERRGAGADAERTVGGGTVGHALLLGLRDIKGKTGDSRVDRKSTRLTSSLQSALRIPSSACKKKTIT